MELLRLYKSNVYADIKYSLVPISTARVCDIFEYKNREPFKFALHIDKFSIEQFSEPLFAIFMLLPQFKELLPVIFAVSL